MTDTDNSGNPAQLPLAEQIERSIAERMRGRADMERLIHERAEDPAGLAFYWLPFFPEWSLLESAFLLFGRNPNHFKGKDAPPCVDNLYRVMQQKRLPDPIRPIDAARWFQEQFGAHYDLPPQLVALLAKSPAGEPDRPERGKAAKRETELQMHKRECQEIGKRLWAENQNSTKANIMKHTDMLFYVQAYKGKNTIPGWLTEIDPRPKDKRRGRPKKIPV